MPESFSALTIQFNLVHVIALLFVTFLHFLAEPLRWFFYTKDSFNVTYNKLFSIFSLTALINYILPLKMGLPIRMFLIRTKTKIGITQCSIFFMLDGVINYACWAIISISCLLFLSKNIVFETTTLNIISISIFLLFLTIFLFHKRHLFFNNKLKEKIKQLKSKYEIINTNIHTVVLSICFMLLDVGSHVLRHWVIFLMLDINIEWQLVILITTTSILTGILSMMPMGLGGYDTMLVLLLTQHAIEPEKAVSVALINRLCSLVISLIIGIYGGTQLNINPFKNNLQKEIIN